MHDWMIAPAYGPGLQFERIAINQGALCIECKACGRRSALTAEAQERGNLTRAHAPASLISRTAINYLETMFLVACAC